MYQPLQSPHDDHSLRQMMLMQHSFLCYLMLLSNQCPCFPQLLASAEVGADFALPAREGPVKTQHYNIIRFFYFILKVQNYELEAQGNQSITKNEAVM